MFDKFERPHFVTATSSAIFAFLHLTDFFLTSPIELVKKRHYAPFNGELDRGLSDARQESPPAFAAFNETGIYCLEYIIANYAMPKPVTDKPRLIRDVVSQFHKGSDVAFSNINAMIVFLTRAKQVGIQNDECLSEVKLDDLLKNMRGTIQFFYLLLIIGHHIAPDFAKMDSLDPIDKDNILAAIKTHFSFKGLLDRMTSTGIDIESIYKAPTEDGLKQVIKLLQLPKTLTVIQQESYRDYEYPDNEIEMFCNPEPSIITKWRFVESQVTLPFTDVFVAQQSTFPRISKGVERAPGFFCEMIVRADSHCDVGTFLKDLADSSITQLTLTKFHAEMVNYIKHFEEKLNLLLTILDAEPSNVLDSPYGHFVTEPFPIVFGVDRMETMVSNTTFYMKEAEEYRTSIPPQLGKNIRVIATDTPRNQEKLRAYLEQHHLSSVAVVSFNDFYKARAFSESLLSPAAGVALRRQGLLAHSGQAEVKHAERLETQQQRP